MNIKAGIIGMICKWIALVFFAFVVYFIWKQYDLKCVWTCLKQFDWNCVQFCSKGCVI